MNEEWFLLLIANVPSITLFIISAILVIKRVDKWWLFFLFGVLFHASYGN